MNTAIDDTIPSEEDLLQLQLQIAQRADELAQSQAGSRTQESDWHCWLEAERDVLARPGDAALCA
jgi:hypothetical protein